MPNFPPGNRRQMSSIKKGMVINMIKKLLGCIREFKRPTIITLCLMIMEAAVETCIPFVTANLVNKLRVGAEISDVIKTGILLIVMAVCSLTCGGLAGVTSAKASSGFARNLRSDIFNKVQTYSFENIDKFSSTSLVTRVTTDVANVQMSYMMIIRTAVRSPLMLIFSVIMATIMGGSLAFTFVVIIPVLTFGLIMISKKAMPAFRRVFKKYDKLNESIEENVRGARVVKGFSREEHENKKFEAASENIKDDFTKAERIVALNNPIMQICLYFNMIFVLFFGSKMAIESSGADLDVGQISAMLTYGMQVLMSLMMLSMIYVIITMSGESFKRIYEVLAEEPAMKNPDKPVYEVVDGSVDFDNVSFKYSKKAEKFTLSDIDIHIKSGSVVGIIGGTGSSKSTLVNLIPRLYDVTEGSVKVGGVDVRNYDIDALRSQVAVVLQKNLLFAGTIKDNLRWGNENATDDEIIGACKLAEADSFVSTFPNGYDTWIEQGGTNVSGGQKQRLCIARALLKKPKILILDDSTSAVDTKTDAMIRRGFSEYVPDTTKIIIAQRISSVMDADLILVLDGGKLVSSGTHSELLESSDIYRDVYLQQTESSRGGSGNEE